MSDNVENMKKALDLFYKPGEVVELRILGLNRGKSDTGSGYFDDMRKLAEEAVKLDGLATGLYTTLNQVNPALIARRKNRMQVGGRLTSTTDQDITRRTHLLIDVDANKPASDISSTDAEHAAAIALGERMRTWFRNWKFPGSIFVDSGNGCQIIYDIDLPNDKESELIVRSVLECAKDYALDFPTEGNVDTTVFNASRIFKLVGSLAKKGDDTPERPHRRSCILKIDDDRAVVPTQILKDIHNYWQSQHRDIKPIKKYDELKIDAKDLMSKMGVRPISERRFGDRTIYKLDRCPKDSNHDGAFVVAFDSGWVRVGCPHNSCGGTTRDRTKDYLDEYMPGWNAAAEKNSISKAEAGRQRLEKDLGVVPNTQPKVPKTETVVAETPKTETVVPIPTSGTPDVPAGGDDPLGGGSAPPEDSFRRTRSLDDMGNAARFVDDHYGYLRYCPTESCWYYYNGKVWESSPAKDDSKPNRLADRTVDALAEELRAIPNDEEKDRAIMIDHIKYSRSKRGRDAMIGLAKNHMTIYPDKFDRDPWLLNMKNGTINLKTRDFHKHNKEDYLTFICNINYNPDAKLSLFPAFIKRITQGARDVEEYLQKIYALAGTGINNQKNFYVMWGDTDTGKSTLTNLIAWIYGSYTVPAKIQTFTMMPKQADSPPFDLARLVNARMVLCAEAADGRMFNTSLIKQWTGGDPMVAEKKHAQPFMFKPIGHLFFYTNHVPRIDYDGAMLRRIKIVLFPERIPIAEQDEELLDKLRAEAEAVFVQWLMPGNDLWQKEGFKEPEIVRKAVEEYSVSSTDQVSTFVYDRLVDIVGYQELTVLEVYEDYRMWSGEGGERNTLSMRMFNQKMKDRGYRTIQAYGGRYYWKGIAFKNGSRVKELDKFILDVVRTYAKDSDKGVSAHRIKGECSKAGYTDDKSVYSRIKELCKNGEIYEPFQSEMYMVAKKSPKIGDYNKEG